MKPYGKARAKARKQSDNPYVGPRAFRSENQLFGRGRETRELSTLLIAERIILLHAPSGAGKTSLIQAALMKELEDEEFHVSGPLRLNGVPPARLGAVNPYVWSAVVGLMEAGDAAAVSRLPSSVSDCLDRLEKERGIGEHVLIFDQFEELLTLDPPDRVGQRQFCEDVGRALEQQHRWALFSMREDFMGGLDRYLGLIPSRLRVRYRLDFLGLEAAMEAAREPARTMKVEFTEPAAKLLIDDLAKIRVHRPGREAREKQGSYVEPVQLQVVCHTVWRRLAKELGASFTRIDTEHVEGYRDFELALGGYYAETVAEAAEASEVPEHTIRRWFESELITERNFRSQCLTGPEVDGGDAESLLTFLEGRYLIRSDKRGENWWYELSHDGLVMPVRANNRLWFHARLGPWEELARGWTAADRDRSLLLRGEPLRDARRWLAEHEQEAGGLVREFVAASLDARKQEKEIARARQEARAKGKLLASVSRVVVAVSLVATAEAVFIVYLLAR